MKEHQFILQVFNIPQGLKREDLKIEHDNLESWELMGTDIENGERVANISLYFKEPTTTEALNGTVGVSASTYEVQGGDLYISNW